MNGSSQNDFGRGLGSRGQLAPEQMSGYLQQQALLQQPQYGGNMQQNNLEALLRSTALAQQLQNSTGTVLSLYGCKWCASSECMSPPLMQVYLLHHHVSVQFKAIR